MVESQSKNEIWSSTLVGWLVGVSPQMRLKMGVSPQMKATEALAHKQGPNMAAGSASFHMWLHADSQSSGWYHA